MQQTNRRLSIRAFIRAQATAPSPPAGGPPPVASDISGAGLSAADRLPLGKQAVAVTVDVLAPTSMNLKQPATLKLIVRNTGIADAYNVRIDDELPDGLKFLSSQPDMLVSGTGQHLSLLLPLLTAGSDKVITIKVEPQKVGPFDHAATVKFETGCKTRTTVLQPRLKVDIIANPTGGKVLRGQQVEFKVSIHNTGDGPARNVAILAKLSPGLKHDSGPRVDEQMVYELSIPELPQNATEKLDPLVADAILGGEQFCTVTAKSPDVVFEKEEAENTKRIEVVEPKLNIAIEGPDQRYTDTIADYKITLTNPGTAAARKIQVLATLPVNGVLVKKPRDATYDATSSKLYWRVDQLEAGPKSQTFPFQVRVGGKGSYEVIADAIGEGGLKPHARKTTDVIGMPDVDLVVSESKRVVDVGGQTTFQIRIRNYGTEDAKNLQVSAEMSPNLNFVKYGSANSDVRANWGEVKHTLIFDKIDKLGPNKEIILGVMVSVGGPQPKIATCRVFVTHDDLPDGHKFEDMASVKVTTATRGPVAAAGGP